MLRGLIVVLAIVAAVRDAAAAIPACPAAANVTIFVDNGSADAAITLNVTGELRDATATCTGAGATSYATTLECFGHGVVRCGTITALRPGAWVHRIATTVTGSAPQVQARQAVLIGGNGPTVSNVLVWTVYPRSFVVPSTTESDLRSTLDAAAAFTAASGATALVTFDRTAFPGAGAPVTVSLSQTTCATDQRKAALCLDGSRLVVDALDPRGERGGVVLAVGTRAISLIRLYGSDDVLRGLVLQGSTDPNPASQADTVAMAGASARRNRLEDCLVYGPTRGDAVSVSSDAGKPDGGAPADNVLDGCELTGARDKGMKVTTGGHVTVRESCVHDNANGGLQSTLGGSLVAVQNLVQHNIPGPSQSGIGGGKTGEAGARNTLVTRGNIVRFSGARGMTAVESTDATFADDFVADNQFTGARVEATSPATVPSASFDGVAFVCNHNGGITGTCRSSGSDDGDLCTTDAECCDQPGTCCATDPSCADPSRCVPTAPQGFGAVVATCAGCPAPQADFTGANAFTLNVNTYPNALGANFVDAVPSVVIPTSGSQWEHCGGGTTCDTQAILADDVQLAAGGQIDLGTPRAARVGEPTPLEVSRARPRAGDLVRVFGRDFNAIDGADCAQATAPVAPCSAENPRVEFQNHSNRFGNRVVITIGGTNVQVDVDAVTPTMLAFHMPFDCFAPATLSVAKRDPNESSFGESIAFCDAGGCADRPAGAPCDDGSVCTVGDACSADGRCVPGAPLDCGGTCASCDPVAGCVIRPAGYACSDGDACTVGDACPGNGPVCVPGVRSDCEDNDPCTAESCDAHGGCLHDEATGFDAITCRFDRSTFAITGTLGADTRTSKLLVRIFTQMDAKIEAARTAVSTAAVKKARRRVDAVIRKLTALTKRLPHRRVLPPALADELTAEIGQALDAAVQVRAGI